MCVWGGGGGGSTIHCMREAESILGGGGDFPFCTVNGCGGVESHIFPSMRF